MNDSVYQTKDSFGQLCNVAVSGMGVKEISPLPECDLHAEGIKAKEYTVTFTLRYGKLYLEALSGDFKPPLFGHLPILMGAEPEKSDDRVTYTYHTAHPFTGKLTVEKEGRVSVIAFSNGVAISEQFARD